MPVKAKPERKLSKKTIRDLSPGVRALVIWLNKEGFYTTDSGDGSNHEAGMECAHPNPMIVILTKPKWLVEETDRLYRLLKTRGAVFPDSPDSMTEDSPDLQGAYNPNDGYATIIIMNLLSKDVGL